MTSLSLIIASTPEAGADRLYALARAAGATGPPVHLLDQALSLGLMQERLGAPYIGYVRLYPCADRELSLMLGKVQKGDRVLVDRADLYTLHGNAVTYERLLHFARLLDADLIVTVPAATGVEQVFEVLPPSAGRLDRIFERVQ